MKHKSLFLRKAKGRSSVDFSTMYIYMAPTPIGPSYLQFFKIIFHYLYVCSINLFSVFFGTQFSNPTSSVLVPRSHSGRERSGFEISKVAWYAPGRGTPI